jgi:hypothetical protein
VLPEREGRLHQVAGLAEERVRLALAGHRLAVQPRQFGLVVERVDVADAAGAEHLDDALRLGLVVRP